MRRKCVREHYTSGCQPVGRGPPSDFRSNPRGVVRSVARKASVWFLLLPSVVAVTVLNKCEIGCGGPENVAVSVILSILN
jgi:hypothetical protein